MLVVCIVLGIIIAAIIIKNPNASILLLGIFLILLGISLSGCGPTTVNCNSNNTCNPIVNITGNTVNTDGLGINPSGSTDLIHHSLQDGEIGRITIGDLKDFDNSNLEKAEHSGLEYQYVFNRNDVSAFIHPESGNTIIIDPAFMADERRVDMSGMTSQDLPRGTFNYKGVHAYTIGGESGNYNTGFEMTANFTTGEGTIRATGHSSEVDFDYENDTSLNALIRGSINIDRRTGVFEDNNLTATVIEYSYLRYPGGTSWYGVEENKYIDQLDLYGHFSHNGDFARAIYHSPHISGGLLGVKQ